MYPIRLVFIIDGQMFPVTVDEEAHLFVARDKALSKIGSKSYGQWDIHDETGTVLPPENIIQSFKFPKNGRLFLYRRKEAAPSLERGAKATMPAIHAVCPTCGTNLTLNFQTAPVIDLVCEWSQQIMSDTRMAVAKIVDGDVIVSVALVGKRVVSSVTLGKELPHQTGGTCIFELHELAPGVLKLSPSILDAQQGLHAYVTIVGAPDNWRSLCEPRKTQG